MLLFSDLLNQKYKKYLAAFYFILDLFIPSIIFLSGPFANFWRRGLKGIDNPFNTSVACICYLCAGAICAVLRGSPTSLITLVSSLREIPTVAVLHHPFLFWGNTDVVLADRSFSGAIVREQSVFDTSSVAKSSNLK